MTDAQISKTFTHLVLQGKVRQAIRFLTQRDKGGVLQGNDIDSKTGKRVKDVLLSKHPDARIPEPRAFEPYDKIPDFISLDITCDTVTSVVSKMGGSAGHVG